MLTIQNLRKSLVRNWRPVCSLVGGAVSGAEFAPFPSPRFLTPVGMGQSTPGYLFSGISQSLCSANGRQVNFLSLSLAVPQFKLLSHVSSLRLPSGHSSLALTLSNAARSSPFCPLLLVADAGIWGTFLLGVAFRYIICEFYLFSSQLDCPSRFENFPQTSQ